jgi:hypothetical protein
LDSLDICIGTSQNHGYQMLHMIITDLVDSFIVFRGDSQDGRKKMRLSFGEPRDSETIESFHRDYGKVWVIPMFKSRVCKHDLGLGFEMVRRYT